MSRTVAQPTRFDPRSSRPSTSQNSGDYNYTDWAFYESDSYLVSFDLVGKSAYNNSQRSNFIYLGRKTTKSVSVIKFSFYEGGRLLNLVSRCLDEVNARAPDCDKLIPLLEGKPGSKITMSRDNKNDYFNQSQIDMQNVKGRLCFSEVSGDYMLHLLSPVSADITAKLKGWLGPVASLNMQDMERFEGFLKQSLQARE